MIYETNQIAADRVLAYLTFEMEEQGLSQVETDTQFIAVAEALGLRNEVDSPVVDLGDMGQWLKEVSR